MFEQFFQSEVISIGGKTIVWGQIVLLLFLLAALFFTWYIISKRLFPLLYDRNNVLPKPQKSFKRTFNYLCLVLVPVIIIWSLDFDYFFALGKYGRISILLILGAIILLQIARIIDWLISNVFIHKYYTQRDKVKGSKSFLNSDPEKTASRTVTSLVYIIALIIIIQTLNLDYTLFTYESGKEIIPFKISKVFRALFILIGAKFFSWIIIHLGLYGYYKQQQVNKGAQYAVNKIVLYIIYVFAVIIVLQTLGLNMTLIWGGAAALLVGVGLGLQQTFNDFFSGLVLLFERSVEVGDVLDVNGTVGTVKKIGVRSSILKTLENVSLIVPNSIIVNQNVINWSHLDNKVRFKLGIGVSYQSDPEVVKPLILAAAKANKYVIDQPEPIVRFNNFGESSLDFQLLFFSRNYLIIEDIKSDLRFEIKKLFDENKIVIPFPQRDVWIRKQEEEGN